MVKLTMDSVRPELTSVLLAKDGDYMTKIVSIEEYTISKSQNTGWKVTEKIVDADEAGRQCISSFPITGEDTNGKPNFYRLQEFIKSVESTSRSKEDLEAYMLSLLDTQLDTETLIPNLIGKFVYPHMKSSTFKTQAGNTTASTKPQYYTTKETYEQNVALGVHRKDYPEDVQRWKLSKAGTNNGAVPSTVSSAKVQAADAVI